MRLRRSGRARRSPVVSVEPGADLVGQGPVEAWLFRQGGRPVLPRLPQGTTNAAPAPEATEEEAGRKKWRWW